MIGTLEQAQVMLLKKNAGKRQSLKFMVTKRCNIGCEHCYEASMNVDDGGMDRGLITMALDQINPEWTVWMQGGEPMMMPELCLWIANECKKRAIKFALFTSAFWVRDKGKMKLVVEEMRPSIINVSINEWLMKKVPIENLNILADRVANDPDITLFVATCYGTAENFEFNGEKWVDLDRAQPRIAEQFRYKFCRIPTPFMPYRRGKNLDHRVVYFETDEILVCRSAGYTVEMDGRIFANCPTVGFGCQFGYIQKGAHLQRIADAVHTPKLRVLGKTAGFCEACRYAGVHMMDKKWASDDYYETVDLRRVPLDKRWDNPVIQKRTSQHSRG